MILGVVGSGDCACACVNWCDCSEHIVDVACGSVCMSEAVYVRLYRCVCFSVAVVFV